jgi:hypothetical protein
MERDVVWLWITVVSIHQGGAESTAAANTANAVVSFIEIRQRDFETIHTFHKRFADEYKTYLAAHGPPMDELVRVELFNKRLNSYYQPYVKKVKNDEIFGIDPPQTLEANYIAASKYEAPIIGARGESKSAVFYTGHQHQEAELKQRNTKKDKEITKSTKPTTKQNSAKQGGKSRS